jgi:hypothetical protein
MSPVLLLQSVAVYTNCIGFTMIRCTVVDEIVFVISVDDDQDLYQKNLSATLLLVFNLGVHLSAKGLLQLKCHFIRVKTQCYRRNNKICAMENECFQRKEPYKWRLLTSSKQRETRAPPWN